MDRGQHGTIQGGCDNSPDRVGDVEHSLCHGTSVPKDTGKYEAESEGIAKGQSQLKTLRGQRRANSLGNEANVDECGWNA